MFILDCKLRTTNYLLPTATVPGLTIVGLNSTTSSARPFSFCATPNTPAMPVGAFAMSFGRDSPEIITVLPSMTRVTVSARADRISGVDALRNPCFRSPS